MLGHRPREVKAAARVLPWRMRVTPSVLLSLALALPAPVMAAARPSPAPPEARVSIDFKDADIVDIVRLMADVGSFQVVVDPGVSCKLTLKLNAVPLPTVLNVALKVYGLGQDSENGIVRIAPMARIPSKGAHGPWMKVKSLANSAALRSVILSRTPVPCRLAKYQSCPALPVSMSLAPSSNTVVVAAWAVTRRKVLPFCRLA